MHKEPPEAKKSRLCPEKQRFTVGDDNVGRIETWCWQKSFKKTLKQRLVCSLLSYPGVIMRPSHSCQKSSPLHVDLELSGQAPRSGTGDHMSFKFQLFKGASILISKVVGLILFGTRIGRLFSFITHQYRYFGFS